MGKRFVEKNVPEKKWKLHRAVGILLAVAVTCQAMPFDGITVFAAEEVQSAEAAAACTHEHTEDCYKVIEDCIHEHEESCYPEATTSEEGETFTEEENKQPTECMHSCSEESGCITKELDCHHEHDASCGYTQETSSEEETTESPSTFVGEIYNGETTEDTAVSSENTETITETEIETEDEVETEAEDLIAPLAEGSTERQSTSTVSVTIDNTTTYYDTIDDAWAAADGKTATITLLSDVQASGCLETSSGSSDITLDCDQYTLTSASSGSMIWIRSGAFHFIGGTINSGSNTCILLPGVTFTMSGGTLKGSGYYLVNSQGSNKVTITGGTLEGKVFAAASDTFSLSGGTYSQISVAKAAGQRHGNLLAEGYCYYDTASNNPVEKTYADIALRNVTVGKCDHREATFTHLDAGESESDKHEHTRSDCPSCGMAGTTEFCKFTAVTDKSTAAQHTMQCSGCKYSYNEDHRFEDGDTTALKRTCSICQYEESATVKVAIGDRITCYYAIDEAWAAAKGSEATITLLSDTAVSSTLTVESGDNIIFDGGNYALTGKGNVMVMPGGTLSIIGGIFGAMVDICGGTVTFDGGTFQSSVMVNEDAAVTVNDGTFGYMGVNGGTIRFIGGTVASGVVVARGTVTVTDGTFGYVDVSGGTVTLTGGTFHAIDCSEQSGITVDSLLGSGYVYYDENGEMIEGTDQTSLDGYGVITVKQGTICSHNWTNNGLCTVCGKQAAASVTIDGKTAYYLQLAPAVNAANMVVFENAGSAEITLLKSLEASDSYLNFVSRSGSQITLDGHGHTISGYAVQIYPYESMEEYSCGTVNLTDCKIRSDENCTVLFCDATVNLTGCTIDNMAEDWGFAVVMESGTLHISDCTINASGIGLLLEEGDIRISSGTFTGTDAIVIDDWSDRTLADLLERTNSSHRAYYEGAEDSTVIIREGLDGKRLTGTVTVKPCTGTYDYKHIEDTTTHGQTCSVCGDIKSAVNCSYDAATGKCICGSMLAVTLPADLNLTYDGTEKKPAVMVMVDGKTTLIENNDYSVTYQDNIDAGENTAKVIVSGKTFTGTVTKTFSIKRAAPTIAWSSTTQELTYTGSEAAVTVPAVTLVNSETYSGTIKYSYTKKGETTPIDGLPTNAGIYTVRAEIAANGNYTAAESTNMLALTINKASGTLTISEASIQKKFGDVAFSLKCTTNGDGVISYQSSDESVVSVSTDGTASIKGAGTAEITVSLAEGANYTGDIIKTITIDVARGEFTPDPVNRSYLYSRESTGTVDLAVLLPDDCRDVIYHTPSTSGALTYKTEPAVTKNGILSYTLNSGSKDAEGTITVTVATRNYEDITITVKIKLTDKIPVNLKDGTKVTLKNDILTYGEPLSKLLFNEAEFIGDDGETVEGTLAWKDQTAKPDAGMPSAVWVFTPEDDTYSALEDAVSIKVNKAVPRITTAPAAVKRIYSPSKPLEKAELTGGEAAGVDGRALSGTWDWCREDIIPNAGANSYQAVFTPENAANYESAEAVVTVDVEKAVPYLDLKMLPSASAVTYGDSLAMSSLTGGSAQYGDGMGNPGTGTESKLTVAGTFTWKEQNVKPAVADSNQTEYAVIFTPEDTKNYNTAETVMTLIVHKAQDAPNMPPTEMNVSNSIEKVSDVPLPEGWAWQDSDRDTALEPDTSVTAEAVYIGADQGNYMNESVTVAITRSSCEHTAGEILYTGSGEKLPTCTEAGLGHRECTKCHAVIESGITLPATGHDYNEGEVTKEPTVASEGEKTYTCSRCGGIYTESIPKKIPKGFWIDNLEPSIPYTGSAIKQEAIRVYYGDTLLREKTDYTISYKNNTNAGTAQIIVTGKGNYTGKAVKDFMIEPVDISRDSNLSAMVTTAVETGKKLKPAVAVTWNGKPLKEKKDYTLSYDTNIKTAGEYDITVTGNKNYTGVLVRTFHVKQRGTKLLNSAKVTGIKKSYPYTSAYQGSALESDLKNMSVKMGKTMLTRDIDYTVRTENTTAAGTAVIILEAAVTSPYAGEKRITTAITGTDLRKGSIKINSAEKAFSYTGEPVTPQIIVYSGKNGSGSIVPAGAYTVSYSSNIDKGRATVTATGIPEKGCSGSVQCTFQIGTLNLETEKAAGNIKITMPADISHAKGGAVPQPVITHTYHQTTRTLREGADYALKYSGNMTAGGSQNAHRQNHRNRKLQREHHGNIRYLRAGHQQAVRDRDRQGVQEK